MDSSEIKRRLEVFFRRDRSGVAAAWLFGSRARGTAGPSSDIDVAVLFSQDPPRTLAAVPSDLLAGVAHELGAGAPRVDLVVVNHASCDLVHRVLRDGLLLVEHDRSARVRFETRKRAEYFDLKPFLDRYRRKPPPRAP